MLNRISQFFEKHLQHEDGSEELSFEQKQLAVAALLIEVAVADYNLEDSELASLRAILERKFKLSSERLDELRELALAEQSDATSLYQFTHLINDECSAKEKYCLIEAMWEIAYADGSLHKYQEALIRKVAELIYVSHSQFIRARNTVRDNQSPSA
ncbi:TerB family tellurite resistance protein [Marinimicrobium sp. ABcell2]|uniref:tellurite resistance TerB family protein n=1 Tax=Marinimicrobium sp. ABcell2 TaxID=3069751 RepID=UPI0027B4CAB5|nr:TerB family tellurite resistance protein [Marinimicrobium sp. ABcell2]MDQ2077145.1 TerB family tellurite resistance protein [Marinimicrobium sp. ABcell2]